MKAVKVTAALRQAFMLGSAVFAIAAAPGDASAQNFCPGGQFNDGTCQIGGQGAVSTAALSSQSLSEASQNASQISNEQAARVVRRRSDQEREAAAAPEARRAAPAARRAAPVRDAKDPIIVKAAPAPVSYGPSYAFWTHGYGDYEKWNTDFGAIRGGVGLLLGQDPATVSMTRKTTTFGVLGGMDATYRAMDSVYVFGLLGGYTDSTIKLNAVSVGRSADNSTISAVNADITGGSVGAYLTFSSGAFSADVTAKVDFLTIDQSFTEILFARAAPVTVRGALSTDVVNYNIMGNWNYRIPASAYSWWEPTVGIRATYSDFERDAFRLGLSDGSVVRLQGGLRWGMTSEGWWGTTVVTTLTGLAYSDVLVNGLTVSAGGIVGGTGGLAVAPTQEGLLRGQGILTMNFIHSASMSTFIQGEVRGGDDYYGYGGKVGFRVGLN